MEGAIEASEQSPDGSQCEGIVYVFFLHMQQFDIIIRRLNYY